MKPSTRAATLRSGLGNLTVDGFRLAITQAGRRPAPAPAPAPAGVARADGMAE